MPGLAVVAVVSLGVCALGGSSLSAQILPPAPPEAAAKVITLTGQVSVLRDADPWALNVGDSVQPQQVIVTGPDGYALFQVADGSTFEVFPNSNVIFRKNPPNWRDLLDVFVGRIKVHIEKMGGQPNPNRIHTPTAVISVRGTTFDVSVDPADESTLVAVEEGQVAVRHALRGETKMLNAGESVQVYKNVPLAQNVVDKSAVAQRLIRALTDALYTLESNSRGLPGKISLPVPSQGQTHPTPPPPPPPPAAPPPLPPH